MIKKIVDDDWDGGCGLKKEQKKAQKRIDI